jgi:hypothetical protein
MHTKFRRHFLQFFISRPMIAQSQPPIRRHEMKAVWRFEGFERFDAHSHLRSVCFLPFAFEQSPLTIEQRTLTLKQSVLTTGPVAWQSRRSDHQFRAGKTPKLSPTVHNEVINIMELAGKSQTDKSPQELSQVVHKVGTNRHLSRKTVTFSFSEPYNFIPSLLASLEASTANTVPSLCDENWWNTNWCTQEELNL